MNDRSAPETGTANELSLFKRHENLTVTVIFIAFVIVIAVLAARVVQPRNQTAMK